VLVEATLANGRRLRAALVEFGFGAVAPDPAELAKRGPWWLLGLTGSIPGESLLELGWVAEGITWSDGPKGGGPKDGYFAVKVNVVPAPSPPDPGRGGAAGSESAASTGGSSGSSGAGGGAPSGWGSESSISPGGADAVPGSDNAGLEGGCRMMPRASRPRSDAALIGLFFALVLGVRRRRRD
jgi:hypothetical protein